MNTSTFENATSYRFREDPDLPGNNAEATVLKVRPLGPAGQPFGRERRLYRTQAGVYYTHRTGKVGEERYVFEKFPSELVPTHA